MHHAIAGLMGNCVLLMASMALAQVPSEANLSPRLSVGQAPVWALSPTTTTAAPLGAPAPSPAPGPVAMPVGAPVPIRLEARVDRANLTYSVGDPVSLRLRASRDAYITIFNTRADGTITVMVPNPYHRDNRVRGGQEVTIPQAGYVFGAICPAGIELITVIASHHPLPLPQLHPTALSRSSSFAQVDMTGAALAAALRLGVFPTGGTQAPAPTTWPAAQPAPTPQAQLPSASSPALTGAAVTNLLIQVGENPARPCPPTGGAMPAAAAPVDLPMHLVALLGGAGTAPPPLASATAPGTIRVQTERAVYRPGQAVHVMVSVGRACRLSVFHVRTDGQTQQMFPNPQQPEQMVQPGEVRLVPSTDAAQRFTAGSTRGNESVIAICEDPAQRPVVPVVAPTAPGWNPSLGGFVQVVGSNRIGLFATGAYASAPAPGPSAVAATTALLDRQATSYSIEPAP